MKLSKILFAIKTPQSPFPLKGNKFDKLFVEPVRRKKAWDGQDKDAFFRDKYAHVHAKQLKRKQEEQDLKKEKLKGRAPSTKTALKAPLPKPDFARMFTENLMKNPKLEYIYGTNAVRAVLESRKCHTLFTNHKYTIDLDASIRKLCETNEVKIETNVPQQHLQIMSDYGVHNKVVVKTEKKPSLRAESIQLADSGDKLVVNNEVEIPVKSRPFKYPLGLFIDQITDTHNMGALLRSVQFFGADFVAISSRNSAPLSPAVIRASSGAAEFVPIVEVAKPLKLFDQLRESGWAIVTTAPNQQALKQHGIELRKQKPSELQGLEQPTLLVVGNEGDGIRTSLLQRSTHQTILPTTQSEIDSLNVSVAAAVLLSKFVE